MSARRSGYYRMTPARRAALRKAQLASARARRKQKIRTGLAVVGTIATTAAIYGIQHQANSLATHPLKTVHGYNEGIKQIKGFVQRGNKPKDPNAPGPVKRVSVSPLAKRSVRYHMGVHSVHGHRIRSYR